MQNLIENLVKSEDCESSNPTMINRTQDNNEDFLSAILKASPIVIYVYCLETYRFTYLNHQTERLFGYSAADTEKMNESSFTRLIHPSDWKTLLSHFRDLRFLADEKVHELECRFRHKSGEWLWIKCYDKVFRRNEKNRITHIVGYAEDITRIKQVQEEKLRLAAIVESSDDAIVSTSFDGTILSWNKGAEKIYGYTESEAVRQNISLLFTENYSAAEEIELLEKIATGKHINSFETTRRNKKGNNIPISLTVSPVKNAEDEIVAVSTIARDISRQRQAESALRQSEERYRMFIAQSSEGIWRFEMGNPIPVNQISPEEQIELIYQNAYLAEANDAMAQQYGFEYAEELIGKRIGEFLKRENPASESHLRSLIDSNYHLSDSETVENDNIGEQKYFLNNVIGIIEDGLLVRIWGMQRDITAAKQTEKAYLMAERKLQQTQKIEAVGKLAGGLAHDFNNFLAVIMLHVDLLQEQLAADSSVLYRIDEIREVTKNAAEMVRQLLAFSRKQPMQPHPIVLNQIVKEFIKIIRPLIGEDIEVQIDLDTDLGVCFVDYTQINQILMNLAVNSRDAIREFGDRRGENINGKIYIKTSNVFLDKTSFRHEAQPVGAYVRLTVSDNGIGMDMKTQEHIFEPFFTTKEVGKGTGLGLSTVYGIVKQSNGFVWAKSEMDKGTTLTIEFPRVDQPVNEAKPKNDAPIPVGTETILLVEDEEPIRRAMVEVLKNLGYQVFETNSGVKAVQLAEIFNDPIDLLITDVIMPQMNGKDLADKVKSLHPETSVLFISGYNNDIIARHGVLEENVRFLGKPFSHQELAIKVRETLDF